MMGRSDGTAWLFYDYCLDDHVPPDHRLRSIGKHLDLDSRSTRN
jgi:hypothetical protein